VRCAVPRGPAAFRGSTPRCRRISRRRRGRMGAREGRAARVPRAIGVRAMGVVVGVPGDLAGSRRFDHGDRVARHRRQLGKAAAADRIAVQEPRQRWPNDLWFRFMQYDLLGVRFALNVFVASAILWVLLRDVADTNPIWAIASMVAAADPQVKEATRMFRS